MSTFGDLQDSIEKRKKAEKLMNDFIKEALAEK